MQYSHSSIDCFKKCKFKYKMHYLDDVETIPPVDADNALVLGTAIHTGIEVDPETAIREYSFSYPVITDEHINEIIKLEKVIPMARAAIPSGGYFEVEISDKDFHGFIDYLIPVELTLDEKDKICSGCNKNDECELAFSGHLCGKYDNEYFDIYDFKYSNNTSSYKKSAQLHLYKFFFERDNPGKKIRNLYFLFIPKVQIKQKKTESLFEFRERLEDELSRIDVKLVQIEFNYENVIEFLFGIKAVNEEIEFAPEKSYLCRYCEYQEYCEKGWSYFMKLPENKRRNIESVEKRTLWIYGAPFCGKTTFANSFPDPLMLNTDGNIKFVDAPYIRIRDEVKVEGRQTKRTFAWDIFKDTIGELEKKENTFQTIVVDLLEDMYEYCRIYMYHQLGITHESDDSFRAWDKVRGEFLNTLKRLMNLDYQNIILISHEDTSRDITKKTGDKITAIKPSLPDKVANKVAGMVDVVARIVAGGDNSMWSFSFKSDEVVFGGGRLRIDETDIPLDVNALFAIYDEANKNAIDFSSKATQKKSASKTKKKVEKPNTVTEKAQDVEETEICEKDTYFYIPSDDNYVVKHKGDPFPENGKVITKEEFNEGCKKIAQEANSIADAMNHPEVTDEAETPRRRRKPRED